MKSLVLCKSKATAKLGPQPSSSCCRSRPNLGPFKQFLMGHFLLFVVCDIKSSQSCKSCSSFCIIAESFFSPSCTPLLSWSHGSCLQGFCRKWNQRGQIQRYRWREKMALKYKETLVDRSCSQQVFMEDLRLRVKSPCKA